MKKRTFATLRDITVCLGIIKQCYKLSSLVDDRSIYRLKSLASQGACSSMSSPNHQKSSIMDFILVLKISIKLPHLHLWAFWEIRIWCVHMKLTFNVVKSPVKYLARYNNWWSLKKISFWECMLQSWLNRLLKITKLTLLGLLTGK